MPVYRNRIAIEIGWRIKAFLGIEAGVTRGELPRYGPGACSSGTFGGLKRWSGQVRKLKLSGDGLQRVVRRIVGKKTAASMQSSPVTGAVGEINPANIVWIFGIGRSGSTWLARMIDELPGQTVWFEPRVGDLFDPIHLKSERRKGGSHFILGERYKESWLPLIRRFILDGARSRFPGIKRNEYLAIKEPSGSAAAPYLMEAVPESRMILLVRDPRDVAASWVDAHRKGDWVSGRRGGGVSPYERKDKRLNNLVKKTARKYLRNVGNAMRAYKAHQGYKVLVHYEDLRADPLKIMKRIYSTLEIPVAEEELVRVVERHSWENMPKEKKGEGKFYRKATPGGWRKDLTSHQVRIVQTITAPVMKELYPEPASYDENA